MEEYICSFVNTPKNAHYILVHCFLFLYPSLHTHTCNMFTDSHNYLTILLTSFYVLQHLVLSKLKTLKTVNQSDVQYKSTFQKQTHTNTSRMEKNIILTWDFVSYTDTGTVVLRPHQKQMQKIF